jgi:hypothetical protein
VDIVLLLFAGVGFGVGFTTPILMKIELDQEVVSSCKN